MAETVFDNRRDIFMDSKIHEDETREDYYLRIRKSFLHRVFKNKYYFDGKIIKFKKYKNSEGQVECFHHVITSRNGDMKRVNSIERYEMSLLVFLILDDCSCNKVQCQCITKRPNYNHPDRISLYCSKYKYVIILEPKSDWNEFITAFPVNEKNEFKYL